MSGRAVGIASTKDSFPVSEDAAEFLMNARCTRGFVVETTVSLDRARSHGIALHGNYIIEGSVKLAALPITGSLIIVAPETNSNEARSEVRVLAMIG